jgi:hypothetical protein
MSREAWEDIARNFQTTMKQLKVISGGARLHFFVSAPGALAFALGSFWGTVNEMPIYHYQGNTYHLVSETTKKFKT